VINIGDEYVVQTPEATCALYQRFDTGETESGLAVDPNEVGAPKADVASDCQSIRFPRFPDNVILVDDPLQIGLTLAVVVPPVTTLTVSVILLEKVVAHKAPFDITALYHVFCGTLVTVMEVVAEEEMAVQLVPLLIEYSHLTIEPQAGAVEFKVELLVAVQISALVDEVIFPVDDEIEAVVAVGAGNTETVLVEVADEEQPPKLNVTLNT